MDTRNSIPFLRRIEVLPPRNLPESDFCPEAAVSLIDTRGIPTPPAAQAVFDGVVDPGFGIVREEFVIE